MKKILIISMLGLMAFLCFAQKKQEAKPNIIFILADDLSYNDLSCFGQNKFKTPNIDRIAQEGIVFTKSYSAQGECAPSRCGLLTGMHMGHATVRSNVSVRGEEYLNDSDFTIAEMLNESNYATAFIGKWGVGLPGSEGEPNKQGFDYSFGFYDQRQAHTYYPTYLYENGNKIDIPENKGYDIKKMYDYNSRSTSVLLKSISVL
jgi:arylsulfatase A-like enzyme